MAFTVYLSDSTVVTYGPGYQSRIDPSGYLSITGNNRGRIYAPGYWTQLDDHDEDTAPDNRHDTTPGSPRQLYYDTTARPATEI